MNRKSVAVWPLLILGVAFASPPLAAHEGHDHDEPVPAPVMAPAGPRLTVATERFELVGALHGNELVLWLDRSADTAPVRNARLEIELQGMIRPARPEGEVYRVTLETPLPAGRWPVAATVVTPDDADVLVGAIEVTEVPPQTPAPQASANLPPWVWLLGATVVTLLAYGLGRRARSGGALA